MLANVAASSAARRRAEAGRVMKQNLRIYGRLQVTGSGAGWVWRAGQSWRAPCPSTSGLKPQLTLPTLPPPSVDPTTPQAIKPSRDVARAAHERDFARHERQLATLAAVRRGVGVAGWRR